MGGLPYSKISVADPGNPKHPFFVVDLTSSILTSVGLPFSTKYMPLSMYMAMPPLPHSPYWREDGRVGTDHWLASAPVINGKAGLIWASGGLADGKFGDGVGFPDVKPFSFGMWLRDSVLEIEVSKQLDKDSSSHSDQREEGNAAAKI